MKLIIANWKSNKNLQEADTWLDDFLNQINSNLNNQILLAVPFPLIYPVQEKIKDINNISLAVQDLSPFPAGAYTGAVSTKNLEGLKITYAILGHSERRQYFAETEIQVANKVELALEAGITPIVCVDDPYLASQAAAIKQEYLSKCLVAYEALEAIGTGKSKPIEQVQKVYAQIDQEFGKVPKIYGGSLTPENYGAYLNLSDGILIGGASLDANKFSKMLV